MVGLNLGRLLFSFGLDPKPFLFAAFHSAIHSGKFDCLADSICDKH
jgi:hypothetical protein